MERYPGVLIWKVRIAAVGESYADSFCVIIEDRLDKRILHVQHDSSLSKALADSFFGTLLLLLAGLHFTNEARVGEPGACGARRGLLMRFYGTTKGPDTCLVDRKS